MRLPVLIVVACVLVNLAIDWYIYLTIKNRAHTPLLRRIHIYTTVALLAYIIIGISIPRRSGSDESLLNIMWIIYSYFTVYLPKWIYTIFEILASIPQLWKSRRLKGVSIAGVIFAICTFALMWWGALINRFNIEITTTEVEIENLPDCFNGYRIAQFSDLHVGTYKSDTTFISNVVDAINGQKPDVIVFTGDIVNRRSDELYPFKSTLSRLHATDGVYSILGNHDYGDYINWTDSTSKADNLNSLISTQKEMGWRLLLNKHEIIRRGNDSIAIIGVENWGDPPFTVYGDLNKAYSTLNDSTTKILLTHNPAHWCAEVANDDSTNIALSLSGHTHAMQVSLLGFSPAKWRYNTWGGLYENAGKQKHLYVNVGIGTVALPTRIGATPEVSIITLRKK